MFIVTLNYFFPGIIAVYSCCYPANSAPKKNDDIAIHKTIYSETIKSC